MSATTYVIPHRADGPGLDVPLQRVIDGEGDLGAHPRARDRLREIGIHEEPVGAYTSAYTALWRN